MTVKAHKSTAARKRLGVGHILQDTQVRICNGFDFLFPKSFRIDGYSDFRQKIVPRFLTRHNQRVYELCHDHSPVISAEDKRKHDLRIIALHQSEYELALMPAASYDTAIVTDITKFNGAEDGDLVIGDSTLNHTDDCPEALRRIATLIKPGGLGLLYVTSRHSLYARMCNTVPRGFWRKVLFRVFPPKGVSYDLSKARYNQCSPKELRHIALANGLELLTTRYYYSGPYYRTVFPVYVFWRIWTALKKIFLPEKAAESFTLILQKRR